MKKYCLYILIPSAILFMSWKLIGDNWLSKKQKGYTLSYTAADENNVKDYKRFIDKGIVSVKKFFDASYKKEFTVFIHPSRHSLDSTWQIDWKMPAFRSECWMVASGVATKLDMISPKLWDKLACDHIYSETEKTQQLITHELFHIFHGQFNSSPDFTDTEGIDWFVEGLATYASGQCDSSRIKEVKKAIADNKIPASLDKFWTGKIKYGLSGSVVMYIDQKYGRTKLKELLPFNKKSQILSLLNITETELLDQWKEFIKAL